MNSNGLHSSNMNWRCSECSVIFQSREDLILDLVERTSMKQKNHFKKGPFKIEEAVLSRCFRPLILISYFSKFGPGLLCCFVSFQKATLALGDNERKSNFIVFPSKQTSRLKQ